jgi:hypothetical protein
MVHGSVRRRLGCSRAERDASGCTNHSKSVEKGRELSLPKTLPAFEIKQPTSFGKLKGFSASASKTEWHRVGAFNRLGEPIADTLHKRDHVLVDGQLVSSNYDRENGKSKKAEAPKVDIFWSVRANSVRRLSRTESEADVFRYFC